MESKIGAIQDWVGTEKLSTEDKKNFKKNIEGTYQEDDLNEVSKRLKMLVGGGGLKALEGLTPNEPDRPWDPDSIDSSREVKLSRQPTNYLTRRATEVPMYEP